METKEQVILAYVVLIVRISLWVLYQVPSFLYFSEFDYCTAGNFLWVSITIKYA